MDDHKSLENEAAPGTKTTWDYHLWREQLGLNPRKRAANDPSEIAVPSHKSLKSKITDFLGNVLRSSILTIVMIWLVLILLGQVGPFIFGLIGLLSEVCRFVAQNGTKLSSFAADLVAKWFWWMFWIGFSGMMFLFTLETKSSSKNNK